MNEASILSQLHSAGVRVCGRVIVSPYSTKDSSEKMQLINFMIEKAGYTLVDDRGYPSKPPAEGRIT